MSTPVAPVAKTSFRDGTLADAGREAKARISPSEQEGTPAPADVLRKISRSEAVIRRHEPRWRELWAHFDGEQYVEVSAADNSLQRVETRDGGAGKPRWRSRLVRNRFTKAITSEVSVIASRTPMWECSPINADAEPVNAARLGEKVLLSLREPLSVKTVAVRTVQIAAVTGDGFAWPYWDPTMGTPLVDPATGQAFEGKGNLRTGDVKIAVLRQDQVGWAPNVPFEDSRYYVIRLAKPVADVVGAADYIGPKTLPGDATSSAQDMRDGDGQPDLVFEYQYLERPSEASPKGRWLRIAGKKVIAKEADYPCSADVPVVHRMPWIVRSHRDRSLGAGELAIDIQRSINRIVNQLVTWRNLVLNPQVFAPEGSLKTKLTEEPGKVFEYRPTGGGAPKWREVPEIPVSLFKDLEQAYADLDFVVGAGSELPPGVASGQGISQLNEREQSFRAQIIANLAAWYSSLGRHLLYLVQQHYTEQRLLTVQGRFGAELIPDFLGAQLEGVATVRVSEASIEPRTRAAQEAKIVSFADKGWIDPHQAMSALNGGTADALLDAFELDINKAFRNIQRLVAMGRMEGEGPPVAGMMDNHNIHIDVYSQWMKTADYDRQPVAVQQAAMALLQQHKDEKAADELEAAQAMQVQAGAQGMGNAGKPQGPSSAPSSPSLASNAAALQGAPPPNA